MRKMILTNIFIALLLILVISLNQETPLTAAHAGNYYVSPEGSDSNPGTEDKPWKTIQRAADTAAPGARLPSRPGPISRESISDYRGHLQITDCFQGTARR
jgi:hypothetical protein